MDENKEIRSLNEDEVEKVSGGQLSDEELREFFPRTEYPEVAKRNFKVAVCKKCGKRFVRNTTLTHIDPDGGCKINNIKQEHCEPCANEIIYSDPSIFKAK